VPSVATATPTRLPEVCSTVSTTERPPRTDAVNWIVKFDGLRNFRSMPLTLSPGPRSPPVSGTLTKGKPSVLRPEALATVTPDVRLVTTSDMGSSSTSGEVLVMVAEVTYTCSERIKRRELNWTLTRVSRLTSWA
jgi:hypothetical protein